MASTTIQVRMDSELKQQVEAKLKSMGLNMSTAVNMLAHQIVNTPMLDRLPKTVNADKMTDEELRLHLLEGFHEAVNGKSRPAAQVFAEMRAKYNI